ncbi:hypothetical protein DsansV1_C04g0037011 [Dioscorea sansibarensis]
MWVTTRSYGGRMGQVVPLLDTRAPLASFPSSSSLLKLLLHWGSFLPSLRKLPFEP